MLSLRAAAVALGFLLAAGPAVAQTACDPQFMDAIEARGFVEAARENAQNQNLMFKPDSVFEYSCFRDHAPAVQTNAVSQFDADSLNFPTLNQVEQYVYTNYGDIFLDSRYDDTGFTIAAPPADMCNAIASVWEISRCMNFYNREDLEGFFDLTHYTANDPRQLPTSLGACPSLPYVGGVSMAVDVAYNNDTAAWTMPAYARDTTDYISDPVDLQDAMYEPGACGDPIPTGLRVVDLNSAMATTPYDEKVCSNPACVYDPDTDQCTMP